jgi:phosphatidylinositol alpha-1,6-mannosyltransferase
MFENTAGMKIGIVSPEFPPEKGGIQTYAFEYARELARRGHEVTVFTQPHSEGEFRDDSFRIEPVLRGRRRLDHGIAARSMEIWHAMNASYSWFALETAPVFVTVHGNDFLRPYHPVARLDLRQRLHLPLGSAADRWLGDWLTWRLVQRSLPQAAHVFTNSLYTERRLLERHPGCQGRTSAAMVGVADESFASERPPRPNGAAARLITVCRLAEPHKNVDLVLRTLGTLRARFPFHYTIVGDGWLRPSLETLTDELGLRDRVTFTGFLGREPLLNHLLTNDLFILATSKTPVAYEGFGLVYLEANACGCPVLAARIAGAVEAVEEGVSGVFVDQVDIESIARQLARFLSGELHFGAAACVAFARKFSWAKVVDHCLAHYT